MKRRELSIILNAEGSEFESQSLQDKKTFFDKSGCSVMLGQSLYKYDS